MKRQVVVRTQFEAIHRWPNCNIQGVEFLKNPHRHIFHVELKWDVSHGDREIEFILQKRRVEDHILANYSGDIGSKSCEQIAEELMTTFEAQFCSVFEDGENGAELQR